MIYGFVFTAVGPSVIPRFYEMYKKKNFLIPSMRDVSIARSNKSFTCLSVMLLSHVHTTIHLASGKEIQTMTCPLDI